MSDPETVAFAGRGLRVREASSFSRSPLTALMACASLIQQADLAWQAEEAVQ